MQPITITIIITVTAYVNIFTQTEITIRNQCQNLTVSQLLLQSTDRHVQ